MSMDKCSECERMVDTDIDCDFYQIEDHIMCESCREKFINELGQYDKDNISKLTFNPHILTWMKEHLG